MIFKLSFIIVLGILPVMLEADNIQRFNLETKYMHVPLDHFIITGIPESFKLRYLISTKHYAEGGPIFVFVGQRFDITLLANNLGFVFEIAPQFKAVVVFIEHRFYGESLPFGNQTFVNLNNLRYLTTEQVLADYGFVINELKKTYFEYYDIRKTVPVIAFGGSYGGILAAWLRMRYPSIVRGAIASSAPILYYQGSIPCSFFYEKVTQAYEKFGKEQCVKAIKLGWDIIINLTKTKLGKDYISANWKLCSSLKTPDDTEKLIDWLQHILINMAVYNYHYPVQIMVNLPAYPIKVFCHKLTTANFTDTKGFVDVFGALIQLYTNYTGNTICNNIHYKTDDISEFAWGFQSCTEFIQPKCTSENDMFISKDWDLQQYIDKCIQTYGYEPRDLEWTTWTFGGRNLEGHSNIIFGNGMLDPYSVAGVQHNFSSSIMAVNIPEVTHMVDLRNPDPSDNDYILFARKFYIEAIERWLGLV